MSTARRSNVSRLLLTAKQRVRHACHIEHAYRTTLSSRRFISRDTGHVGSHCSYVPLEYSFNYRSVTRMLTFQNSIVHCLSFCLFPLIAYILESKSIIL
jgi:hypothetical protein